jgi:hypothetical protein
MGEVPPDLFLIKGSIGFILDLGGTATYRLVANLGTYSKRTGSRFYRNTYDLSTSSFSDLFKSGYSPSGSVLRCGHIPPVVGHGVPAARSRGTWRLKRASSKIKERIMV